MCALLLFFFTDPAPTEIYTLSLHDALPIYCPHLGAHLGIGGTVVGDSIKCPFHAWRFGGDGACVDVPRSEEHTSELQSQFHLVCRLLLEKKKSIDFIVPPLDYVVAIEQAHR